MKWFTKKCKRQNIQSWYR